MNGPRILGLVRIQARLLVRVQNGLFRVQARLLVRVQAGLLNRVYAGLLNFVQTIFFFLSVVVFIYCYRKIEVV